MRGIPLKTSPFDAEDNKAQQARQARQLRQLRQTYSLQWRGQKHRYNIPIYLQASRVTHHKRPHIHFAPGQRHTMKQHCYYKL